MQLSEADLCPLVYPLLLALVTSYKTRRPSLVSSSWEPGRVADHSGHPVEPITGCIFPVPQTTFSTWLCPFLFRPLSSTIRALCNTNKTRGRRFVHLPKEHFLLYSVLFLSVCHLLVYWGLRGAHGVPSACHGQLSRPREIKMLLFLHNDSHPHSVSCQRGLVNSQHKGSYPFKNGEVSSYSTLQCPRS